MLVEVTQENINQGLRNSFGSCPVAVAMGESSLENVRVIGQFIHYENNLSLLQPYTKTIKTESLLREWIFDFDRGEEVFPIQIEVDEEALYATLVE